MKAPEVTSGLFLCSNLKGMVAQGDVESPRLFQHGAGSGECVVAPLAVVGAHARGPDAAEGRLVRRQVHEGVVDADAAAVDGMNGAANKAFVF